MSRYNFYMRSGSSRDSVLEMIYTDMLTNMGTAYSDNTLSPTYIHQEIFAYAKAIYFLRQQIVEVKNNNLFGNKLTYNLKQYVKDYGIEFLKSDYDKLLFIQLLQATQSTAINEKSLDSILKTLAPHTYTSVYTNDTDDQIFEPNYIQTTNVGLTKPYNQQLATDGFAIPGGVDWTQNPMLGYTSSSMYSSSLNTFRIMLKQSDTFSYDKNKITTFLNIILPVYINYTCQIGAPKNDLDGYKITIIGIAEQDKIYSIDITQVGNDSDPNIIHITLNVYENDTAETVMSNLYYQLNSAGLLITSVSDTTVTIDDYTVLSVAVESTHPEDASLDLILYTSNGNEDNIILDGLHSLS